MLEKQACESQALPWQGSTGASERGTAPGVQGGGDGDGDHGCEGSRAAPTHPSWVQADANGGRGWYNASQAAVIKSRRDYHSTGRGPLRG